MLLYIYTNRVNSLLPVITLFIEGGKSVKCPANLCLRVDLFTLLMKTFTNQRAGSEDAGKIEYFKEIL